MSSVIGSEQCPRCREAGADTSEDNLIRYSDNSAYCFACQYFENDNDKESVQDRNTPASVVNFLTGSYQDIPNRGLTKKVCEFAGYQVGNYTGYLDQKYEEDVTVHIENFKNIFGEIVAQKIRGPNKAFKVIGNSNDMGLYGEWLWEPNPNVFCVITEGVIDMLSVMEVQGIRYPVVSIPNGVSSASKSIKKSLEWLSKWKYCILAFDSDEPGTKATKEASEILEPGKVRVITWPLKDANEMLIHGRAEEIKSLLFSAKEIRPDGVVTFSDIEEQVLTAPKVGLNWPWPAMTNLTYGIRPNELITIMAASGLGKTEFVSECFLHLISEHGVKCGVMSFEQPPHKTYQRAIGKLLNKRIHVPGAEFDKEEVKRLGKEVLDNKLFCYSRAGTVSWEDVRSKIIYYRKALDCQVIVVDNLSSIAAKFDSDERRGIDRAMLELSELVMTLDVTIILVCHISRPSKGRTPFDMGGQVNLSDARGSEGIGQHSTYVFGLERNALAEDSDIRYTTTIRCLKDREYGTARGMTFSVRYNTENGKLEQT